MADWDAPCYGTLDWEGVVEPDSDLIYRVEEGSWELTVVRGVLRIFSKKTFETVTELCISEAFDRYREADADEGENKWDDLGDLFPFVNHADVFIGRRYSGADRKFDDPVDQSEDATDAEGVVDHEDYFGRYSTNELRQTLQFVVETNIALNEEAPKDVFTDRTLTTDFSGDLVAVGGPIANLYTRNLMYGDGVDLPYRYDLNPDDGSPDISGTDPIDLRDLNLGADDRGPNWCLVERDGTAPKVANRPARPERRGQTWIRDYFTIVKAPNVHPDAEATYGTEPKVLGVSGCHGFGTRAAIRALQDPAVLDTLESEAGDGYFQALGRVKRRADEDLEDARLSVPDEHVRLLDVE